MLIYTEQVYYSTYIIFYILVGLREGGRKLEVKERIGAQEALLRDHAGSRAPYLRGGHHARAKQARRCQLSHRVRESGPGAETPRAGRAWSWLPEDKKGALCASDLFSLLVRLKRAGARARAKRFLVRARACPVSPTSPCPPSRSCSSSQRREAHEFYPYILSFSHSVPTRTASQLEG